MSITATFIKSVPDFHSGKLWKLSEPVSYDDDKQTQYVLSSAVIAMFSGPETYIFPAKEDGSVLSWL